MVKFIAQAKAPHWYMINYDGGLPLKQSSSSPQLSFNQGPVQVSLANTGSVKGRMSKYQKNMVKHCQERPKISMRFQGSMKYFFASPRAPMVFRRSSNSLKRWYGSQINRMTSQIVRKTSVECDEYNDRALYCTVVVTIDTDGFLLELPKFEYPPSVPTLPHL